MSKVLKAVNGAVVLNAFSASPAVVKGLNSLTVPIETRDALTFSFFGEDFQVQEVGEGKRSSAQASGYMIVGDTTGQAVLEKAKVDQTEIKDIRFYYDSVGMHFCALDLAQESDGFFQISKAGADGAAGKNEAFKYSLEALPGGAIKNFFYHVSADDIAFVASGSKLSSTATDFVAANFAEGQTLIIDSGTNKGYAKISSVTEHEIVIGTITKVPTWTTVTTGTAVVDEGAGTSVTLHASTY